MLRIFSTFLKILNFLKLRFGGCGTPRPTERALSLRQQLLRVCAYLPRQWLRASRRLDVGLFTLFVAEKLFRSSSKQLGLSVLQFSAFTLWSSDSLCWTTQSAFAAFRSTLPRKVVHRAHEPARRAEIKWRAKCILLSQKQTLDEHTQSKLTSLPSSYAWLQECQTTSTCMTSNTYSRVLEYESRFDALLLKNIVLSKININKRQL